jgi:hypothetical protein
MKRVLAVVLVLVLAPSGLVAGSRTWTSNNGRYQVEAELVDFKDGVASLKRSDGTVVPVPLIALSAEDQAHIKRLFPGAQEEQARPGAEYREWKSRNGEFSVVAEFVRFSEGKVQLRKMDGTELTVARSKLSTADSKWVGDEVRRQREQDAEAEDAPKTAEKEQPQTLGSQEVPMKLVRLDPPGRKSRGKGAVPSDYVLRLTTPQQFVMQLGEAAVSSGADAREAAFHRVVHKEPTYSIPVPFRGVAKLGGKDYAFALDAVGRQPIGYNKLYFDLNGNGDLTDDKPISTNDVTSLGPGMVQSQFPRVDMTLNVDGKPAEYSFMLSVMGRNTRLQNYVTASLYGAVVREGYVLDGKKRTRLLLLDHNSNGRFDDTVSMRGPSGVSEGDLLLVNPNPKDRLSGDATMGRDRHLVNKIVCLNNHFYSMEIPPAGETLKLTPANVSQGYVTNASPAYRAVLFSDNYGVVMIDGVSNRKVPLLEGTWHVANYTVDATAFTGGSRTAVTATFDKRPVEVTVGKDATAEMPFGAPFRPVVTGARTEGNKVYLSLAIVGAAGERCTSLYVNGTRPPAPRFIVKDSKGTIVHQGNFEWG